MQSQKCEGKVVKTDPAIKLNLPDRNITGESWGDKEEEIATPSSYGRNKKPKLWI